MTFLLEILIYGEYLKEDDDFPEQAESQYIEQANSHIFVQFHLCCIYLVLLFLTSPMQSTQ